MFETTQLQTVSPGRVYFFLVLTTFFWGGSFLFNKLGLREVPPIHFVLIRFSIASLLMAGVCLPRLRRLSGEIIRKGVIVGLALGMTNICFVFGIRGTSISRAGVLNNLFVLFIPLICTLFWRDRVGRANVAGIAFAAAGIALLAGGGGGFSSGDVISTVTALFIALHIIAVSKVLGREDVFLVSLVQFVTVAVMAAVIAIIVPVPSYRIGSTGLISLAYCAVFPTVLCFTLQNLYQRYVSPTRAGLVYTLDPVWSLLAGFVVLGERLSAGEWLGCLLILLAVLLPLMVRCIMERRQE